MDVAEILSPRSSQRTNLALFIIRVACALPVLYHGSGILFGAFGGPGPQHFAAYMHAPVVVGYLVGLAQFAGGLAILSGAFLRAGASCVIIVMLGAVLLVHLPHGFDVSKNGMEFAFSELLLALALLLTGPGAYSLHGILPAALRKL